MKKLYLITTGFLCLFFLGAEPSQKMVRYNHEVYDWLDLLFMDEGSLSPTQSRPLSVAEISKLLNRISPEKLSDQGKSTYRLISRFIKEESVSPSEQEVRFHGSVSQEFYTSTHDLEKEYGFTDRRDFISLQPEIFWGSTAYATADLDILKERTTVNDPDTWTNSWGFWEAWDVKFPYRGFFSLGGPLWNLQAGRDVITWGLGETGQLLLSDAAPYQDYIKVSSLWDKVHFNFTFHSFEPTDYDGSEYSTSGSEENQKFMIGHKVEFLLFKNFRFGINEMMMIGGRDVELRDFNPFNFYHNQFIGRYDYANSIAQLELDYSPLPGLRLYYNFLQDQMKTSYEESRWPIDETVEPNATGHQAGLQQTIPFLKGFLTGGLEWTHTSPWLYLEESASYSINSTYTIDGQTDTGDVTYTDPLGYALGNDCDTAYIFVRFMKPGAYSLESGYSWIRHGELHIDDLLELGVEAYELTGPSGRVETKHVFSARGEYNLKKWLSLYGQIDNIWVENYDNISSDWQYDLQTVVGVTAAW